MDIGDLPHFPIFPPYTTVIADLYEAMHSRCLKKTPFLWGGGYAFRYASSLYSTAKPNGGKRLTPSRNPSSALRLSFSTPITHWPRHRFMGAMHWNEIFEAREGPSDPGWQVALASPRGGGGFQAACPANIEGHTGFSAREVPLNGRRALSIPARLLFRLARGRPNQSPQRRLSKFPNEPAAPTNRIVIAFDNLFSHWLNQYTFLTGFKGLQNFHLI